VPEGGVRIVAQKKGAPLSKRHLTGGRRLPPDQGRGGISSEGEGKIFSIQNVHKKGNVRRSGGKKKNPKEKKKENLSCRGRHHKGSRVQGGKTAGREREHSS